MDNYTELLIIFEKEKQQFSFGFNDYDNAHDYSVIMLYMYEHLGRKTERIETSTGTIIVKIK